MRSRASGVECSARLLRGRIPAQKRGISDVGGSIQGLGFKVLGFMGLGFSGVVWRYHVVSINGVTEYRPRNTTILIIIGPPKA